MAHLNVAAPATASHPAVESLSQGSLGSSAEPLPQLLSPRALPRGPPTATGGGNAAVASGAGPQQSPRAAGNVRSGNGSPLVSPRSTLRGSAVLSPRAASPPRGSTAPRGGGPDMSPTAGGAARRGEERRGQRRPNVGEEFSIHELRRPASSKKLTSTAPIEDDLLELEAVAGGTDLVLVGSSVLRRPGPADTSLAAGGASEMATDDDATRGGPQGSGDAPPPAPRISRRNELRGKSGRDGANADDSELLVAEDISTIAAETGSQQGGNMRDFVTLETWDNIEAKGQEKKASMDQESRSCQEQDQISRSDSEKIVANAEASHKGETPPAPRTDERSRHHRQLGRTFAMAAQTLQHHLLMCLKLLGMMLEQYIERKRKHTGQGQPKARTSFGVSQPSPRLPPSALGVNVEPPGLAWRAPKDIDAHGSLDIVRNLDKGGNQFFLFVAMLDAMLKGSLDATKHAQVKCFDQFPSTEGCKQDEFTSFDGTLTTVYEDEDLESKQKRLDIPQEPNVSAEDHLELQAKYDRIKASISTMQQKLGEDSAHMLQLEETRRDLRAELEQKGIDPSVALSEAEVVPDKPVPLDGLGVVAQRLDARGAVVAEAELQKLAKCMRALKSEVQEHRNKATDANERLAEASGVTESWRKESAELRKLIGIDAEADLVGAIKALVRRRAELGPVRLPPPEPRPTPAGTSKSSTSLATPPTAAGARLQGHSSGRRSHGLAGSRDDLRREAIPSVQRGRRGGPAGLGGQAHSRGGTNDSSKVADGSDRVELKLGELSSRFVEVQRQYRDLVSENKRLREVVGSAPTSSTLTRTAGSRSEASLTAVTESAAQSKTLPSETLPEPRVRSLSINSRGTASTDRSPDPSTCSGWDRERSLDGSQSQSSYTDRSPDSFRSDDSAAYVDRGLLAVEGVAPGRYLPSWPGEVHQLSPLVGARGDPQSQGAQLRRPSSDAMPWPRSPTMGHVERGRQGPGIDASGGRGHAGARGHGTASQPHLVISTPPAPLPGQSTSGTAHGSSARNGRDGVTRASRSGGRKLQEPVVVSGRTSQPVVGKAMRQQGSLSAMPAEGGANGSRAMPRSPPQPDGKNSEAINNLVSIFRGSRMMDADQQRAAEPMPENGVPSPPVAKASVPSPPVAAPARGTPNAPGTAPKIVSMPGVQDMQHVVLAPQTTWDREESETPEKSRSTPIGPHMATRELQASSPPKPSVRSPITSVGSRFGRPGGLTSGGTQQPMLVRGGSARSLTQARTPSPAFERAAHSASAACLRSMESSSRASSAHSSAVSHSPGPHSSRSPGPSIDRDSGIAVASSTARRAASPVMFTQPPTVQAFLASGCAPRGSRATWPTPQMQAQQAQQAQMPRAASPQGTAGQGVPGASRLPLGVSVPGIRRR